MFNFFKSKKDFNFKKYKKLLRKECFMNSKATLHFLIHDIFTNVFNHFKHNLTDEELSEKYKEVKSTLIQNDYEVQKTITILKNKYNQYCCFCGNIKSKLCFDECYPYSLKKMIEANIKNQNS